MNFGDVTDEKESCMIMDKAIDAGINFFDTADVYGGLQWPEIPRGYGISEEIIGRWLKKSGQRGQGCIGYQSTSLWILGRRPAFVSLSYSKSV